ncbi:ABC transporter permease [Tetragenococcus solitarius]|uniref:Transport permease protein n=1 Tax=Tetragenococcus solitarius TaxID=71453 RepID=A0ABN3Y3J1_9ENTE|nr:ABC transporter permease [Tetragenococcus solitarius]
MEVYNIFWKNVKWRFQNPATIVMNIIQPIVWLLLFSSMFTPAEGIGNVSYTTFILPGLLVMTVLTSAGVSCGIANYHLKGGGSFYRIFISPVKRSSIVLGQVLDVEVLSFIGIGILLLVSIPFSINIASGILGFILILFLLFLCVFFVGSLSYALSFVLPDENAFIGFINTVTLPLFFLSTAIMPVEQLPRFFQIVIQFNPFSYVIDCLRTLVMQSIIDWTNILVVTLMLCILGLASFTLAISKLKKAEK